MPMRGELQIPIDRPTYRGLPPDEVWSSIVAAIEEAGRLPNRPEKSPMRASAARA
jgi:hypothetical protein